jgi:hypothetical protein
MYAEGLLAIAAVSTRPGGHSVDSGAKHGVVVG